MTYDDRWTLVTLVGADSATAAPTAGNGAIIISPTQIALWAGANNGAAQGFVARWTDIDPGADNAFSIEMTQFTGSTPGVGTGTASGSKGYALNGIQLIQVPEPSGAALLGLGAGLLALVRRREA